MKKIISCAIVILGLIFWMNTVEATEVNVPTYTLEETEKIIFEKVDEEGDLVITEIEKMPSLSRIEKGTYKISKTKQGAWSVSFHVEIDSKDKIIGASNMSVKALNGSITSNSLTFNSTSATCKFTRKVGTTKVDASVVAKIEKGKLVTN